MLQSSRLRSKFTFLCLAAFCLAAPADVIHLKSGRNINADSTRQVDGRVEYTIGENTFAIPESLVERIDAGGHGRVPSEAPPSPAEDIPPVQGQVDAGQDLSARIIHDGRVDVITLKAIESEGVPQASAVANFIAANFEEKRNHLADAAHYLNTALTFSPEHVVLLEHYASVLDRRVGDVGGRVHDDRPEQHAQASPAVAEHAPQQPAEQHAGHLHVEEALARTQQVVTLHAETSQARDANDAEQKQIVDVDEVAERRDHHRQGDHPLAGARGGRGVRPGHW